MKKTNPTVEHSPVPSAMLIPQFTPRVLWYCRTRDSTVGRANQIGLIDRFVVSNDLVDFVYPT